MIKELIRRHKKKVELLIQEVERPVPYRKKYSPIIALYSFFGLFVTYVPIKRTDNGFMKPEIAIAFHCFTSDEVDTVEEATELGVEFMEWWDQKLAYYERRRFVNK